MRVFKDININLDLPGGILGALTITFVVLKALGYLDWSWWGVFAPLWIPLAIPLAVLAVLGLVAFIVGWVNEPWVRR